MIYTLEYLNEVAEIEIARFDTETKKIDTVVSCGTNVGYVEPKRSQVSFCYETTDKVEINGMVGCWSQHIGYLTMHDEKSSAPCEDAYIAVRDMMEQGALVDLFEALIKQRGGLKDGEWVD
jgi:hypothetical protein